MESFRSAWRAGSFLTLKQEDYLLNALGIGSDLKDRYSNAL